MIKVLVTGGSSGLGKSIVERIAKEEKYFVYFTFCKSEQKSIQIESQFPNVKKVYCDFTDSISVVSLCELIAEKELDIVVNNAISSFSLKHFHKNSIEDVSNGFTFNIVPVMNILLNSVKGFRKRKKGKIVNVLSSYTFDTPPLGCSLYVAEKKYLESISKSIANENNKFNIQINCVSPSFMKTDMNSKVDSRIVEDMEKGAPQKKLLSTEDVADYIHSIIGNDCIYLNGQNINLNAGR